MAIGIDPLTVATQGLLSDNTLLYAVQGLLSVEIEIVTPDEEVVGGGGIVGEPWQQLHKEEKKKLRARITVKAIVDGEEYTQVKYTNDLSIKVRDVEINIDRNATPPVIHVNVKKK